jgi:phage repressor protein C with HTH and peptisase S24 domain
VLLRALDFLREEAVEPGEIIRRKREELGWSQAQLGNRVGISQPAIKKIEAGDSRHSKFLPKIAQVLAIPLSDLDLSLAGVVAAPETAPAARILGERDFPVHASAEGGPGQIIVSHDAVDFMARPAPLIHVRDSYGLLITGTSMEPEYRQGDTALVNPHLPVIQGEVYIFYAEKAGEARATIKFLRRATTDKWLLSQHNPPDGTAKDFTLARREWQWAHRVIGKYSRG